MASAVAVPLARRLARGVEALGPRPYRRHPAVDPRADRHAPPRPRIGALATRSSVDEASPSVHRAQHVEASAHSNPTRGTAVSASQEHLDLRHAGLLLVPQRSTRDRTGDRPFARVRIRLADAKRESRHDLGSRREPSRDMASALRRTRESLKERHHSLVPPWAPAFRSAFTVSEIERGPHTGPDRSVSKARVALVHARAGRRCLRREGVLANRVARDACRLARCDCGNEAVMLADVRSRDSQCYRRRRGSRLVRARRGRAQRRITACARADAQPAHSRHSRHGPGCRRVTHDHTLRLGRLNAAPFAWMRASPQPSAKARSGR